MLSCCLLGRKPIGMVLMPLTISDPQNSAQEAEILCRITISLCSQINIWDQTLAIWLMYNFIVEFQHLRRGVKNEVSAIWNLVGWTRGKMTMTSTKYLMGLPERQRQREGYFKSNLIWTAFLPSSPLIITPLIPNWLKPSDQRQIYLGP